MGGRRLPVPRMGSRVRGKGREVAHGSRRHHPHPNLPPSRGKGEEVSRRHPKRDYYVASRTPLLRMTATTNHPHPNLPPSRGKGNGRLPPFRLHPCELLEVGRHPTHGIAHILRPPVVPTVGFAVVLDVLRIQPTLLGCAEIIVRHADAHSVPVAPQNQQRRLHLVQVVDSGTLPASGRGPYPARPGLPPPRRPAPACPRPTSTCRNESGPAARRSIPPPSAGQGTGKSCTG